MQLSAVKDGSTEAEKEKKECEDIKHYVSRSMNDLTEIKRIQISVLQENVSKYINYDKMNKSTSESENWYNV